MSPTMQGTGRAGRGRRRSRVAMALVVGLSTAGAIGCTTPQEPPPGAPFVGPWHVTGVTGGFTGEVVPLTQGTGISLDIKADHTLSGKGCNRYEATWSGEGSSLSITGPKVVTAVPCPSAAAQQDSRYIRALPLVRSWQLNGVELSLANAEGRVIVTARR